MGHSNVCNSHPKTYTMDLVLAAVVETLMRLSCAAGSAFALRIILIKIIKKIMRQLEASR